MIFKKDETESGQPPLSEAIAQYKAASGGLFIKPAKKLCKFEKDAWILFDKEGALICIVGALGPVFADNLSCALRQVALSHVK